MVGEAKHPSDDEGPLSGITVLDASRVLVGPFCTMQLGDLGADVIKIERPGMGDQTRGWHPPRYGDSEESAYYLSINRNKRSVTLNLETEEGREIFRRLARDVDVVVENFRVGKMQEWGLSYADLREENPGLVYCKLSGYGEWGPDCNRPAYDLIMQAEGGMMSITGTEDGPPVRVGVAIADIGAGMYATQAILAALFHREVGDAEGQKIDVSLLDGQVAWMTYMASYYFATGTPPRRMGSKHPTIAPYQALPTNDGYVVVAVASENLWANLCEALDYPESLNKERFRTNEARVRNREELDAILEDIAGAFSTAEFVELLSKHDVPVSEVKDIADVFDDPQVRERNMLTSIDHPEAGTIKMPGSPMHLSKTPATVRGHPPLLGEHTTEVLREYGYDDDTITEMRRNSII